jgi:A/G-specific adenine glycosylase
MRIPEPEQVPAATELDAFRDEVRAFYRAHRREMPWRDVDDPYAVLVSEVMLQQTQVPRVTPRYLAWLEAFPTVDALAAAPLAAVLEAWQGLGYNRRAVALKRSAEAIVERYVGVVPSDPAELRTLPGIGPTTAAAIANYAYRVPAPFIETNVRAAVLHCFFPEAEDVPDSALWPIVEATWDRTDPRGWGYALMDFGTEIKRTVANPSRRSRHHTRQSVFEGSRRQKRARLLRAVLAAPGGPAEAYAGEVGLAEGEALALLEELGTEGFLTCEAGAWRVPG